MKFTIKNAIRFKKRIEISYLTENNEMLKRQLNEARFNLANQGKKMVDYRLKLKMINHEKINVVFVCHRPAVWESLRSVYEALKDDDVFNVYIVAIPNKKQLPRLGLNHEVYESEGAEDFWENYDCINGFDYKTKEWFDLKKLDPDYVFFQQPYNITRCEAYKSWNVAQYAKIVFVPYGIQTVGCEVFESVHPADFMNCLSYYFSTDMYNYKDLVRWFSNIGNKDMTSIVVTGFPRFDQYLTSINDGVTIWKYKKEEKKFRILWTPRWCTNEGTCTFFDYKDNIIEYAKQHKDVEIVFRPHPQAFIEWQASGEMEEEEQRAFRRICKEVGIIIDENPEYVSTLKSTDCYITDITSLMGEYLITEKPIIYCHKKEYFTDFGKEISDSFYFVTCWTEIERTINNLREGQDKKEKIRSKLISKCLYLPVGGAGKKIVDIIKQDSLK